MDEILNNLPEGFKTIEEFLSADPSKLPEELKDIADRITVTPLMLYGTSSDNTRIASAGRSYLQAVRNEEKLFFTWMPDVARKRYSESNWEKEGIRDFKL